MNSKILKKEKNLIRSTTLTAEKRLTSKFETNTQFDEAKKCQDNS
jgi:hypothetical protein